MMNKSKVFMVMGIITLIISIIGSVGTYAWYVWSTGDDDVTKIATGVGAATVIYDAGASMTGVSLKPVSDKTSGIIKNITIKTSEATTNKITFNLYLDIDTLDDGLKDASFKYELYKSSTLKTSGDFSQDSLDSNLVTCETNSTSHIVLLENETISSTLSTYTLYIWIDETMDNPDTMMNQNFSFKLHAEGENAMIEEALYPDITAVKEGTLAYTIVNTYDTSEKSVVINNSVRYYYDTEHNLMSDVGGNVRYYGADPDNYIYFNCDDYSNQTSDTCETWRIIGVFQDKVKIMRSSQIGKYSWDYTSTGSYDNNWADATLMTLLNDGYYNNSDGVTYYNNSTTATTINFATNGIGIKNDTTRDMIAEVSWNLGGWSSSSVYANQIYGYERGTKVYNTSRPTSWNGKIALAYPSDYGYAADFNTCSRYTLYNYSNSNCTSVNWMKKIITNNGSNSGWLLTPKSGHSNGAWDVSSSGYVGNGSSYVSIAYWVAPVLYLNSELVIESGEGTSGSPYQIVVE